MSIRQDIRDTIKQHNLSSHAGKRPDELVDNLERLYHRESRLKPIFWQLLAVAVFFAVCYIAIVRPVAYRDQRIEVLETDLNLARLQKLSAEHRLDSIGGQHQACMNQLSAEEQMQVRGF